MKNIRNIIPACLICAACLLVGCGFQEEQVESHSFETEPKIGHSVLTTEQIDNLSRNLYFAKIEYLHGAQVRAIYNGGDPEKAEYYNKRLIRAMAEVSVALKNEIGAANSGLVMDNIISEYINERTSPAYFR